MPAACVTGTDSRAYIPVPIKTVFPGTMVGVPLYFREGRGEPFRLFRGPEFSFEESDLAQLRTQGIKRLFVANDDHKRYQAYLRKNLGQVLGNETVPVVKRFGTLNDVIREVLGDVFESGDIDHTVAQVQEFSRQTVDLICRGDAAVSELYRVLYHDYHTFTHSANVSYFAVMLARAAGIGSRNQLYEIAAGGLLHDLGKLDIPDSILTKPDRLNGKELDVVRAHPTAGFVKLCERPEVSFGQLMMVYQHHERLDGRGYPVGSVASDIHEWAKLCAVVDVFDALTSNRPYRVGLSVGETLGVMERESGIAFDADFLKCWKATITSS